MDLISEIAEQMENEGPEWAVPMAQLIVAIVASHLSEVGLGEAAEYLSLVNEAWELRK